MKRKNLILAGLLFAAAGAWGSMRLEAGEPYRGASHIGLSDKVFLNRFDGPACLVQIDMEFFGESAAATSNPGVLTVRRDLRAGFSEKSMREYVATDQFEPKGDMRYTVDYSLVNRIIIETAFGKDSGVGSVISAVADYRDAVVRDYRETAGKLYEEYPDAAGLNYRYSIKGKVVDTGRMYLTYRLEDIRYTGGAHPQTKVSYLNFDENGRVDLAAAFGPESEPVLERLLLEALLKKEKVKNPEQLRAKSYFPDQFFVSPDFYYKGGNFIFVYNPYEIAPYVRGIVEIALPETLLRKNGLRP